MFYSTLFRTAKKKCEQYKYSIIGIVKTKWNIAIIQKVVYSNEWDLHALTRSNIHSKTAALTNSLLFPACHLLSNLLPWTSLLWSTCCHDVCLENSTGWPRPKLSPLKLPWWPPLCSFSALFISLPALITTYWVKVFKCFCPPVPEAHGGQRRSVCHFHVFEHSEYSKHPLPSISWAPLTVLT